jgi:hypothetical protein
LHVRHPIETSDRDFAAAFEAGQVTPAEFDHAAHIRLACGLLAQVPPEVAYERIRDALNGFMARNGVPPEKYHDTMTKAWVLAVEHFLVTTPHASSSADLIAERPQLLDKNLLLAHYSRERLNSSAAREAFVEPDVTPFP